MKTLAQLPLHKRSLVVNIKEGALHTKLLEMGLYSGKPVEVLFKAPLGDPIAVDVDGYVLSMRLDEAAYVEVADVV
ncbi:MAG: FeoA family protein [Fluviicola sp.]|jgi:Fe2+ transport system protein FeoA